jgi:hypothetical protein
MQVGNELVVKEKKKQTEHGGNITYACMKMEK